MRIRLQKILARAGVASRRAAEQIILDGRVTVNLEVVVHLGAQADPETDEIAVDGRPLRLERHVYYLLNKPAGFLTTLKDPFGRPTIAAFLTTLEDRVFPVGRLDADTEGLLLLTNDGDLSARLMHPRYHVPKTYRVKVGGRPSPDTLARLAGGGIVLGNRPVNPAEVILERLTKDGAWLRMTLTEGRHRQVKRMCSAVGHPVQSLKRVRFGPLGLGSLPSGALRALTQEEVAALKRAADRAAFQGPDHAKKRGRSGAKEESRTDL
jgi:pseudouridine synthase